MAAWGLEQQVPERPSGLPGGGTQGYVLRLNRYKELIHDEVEHRPPLEILAEPRAIEQEILRGIEGGSHEAEADELFQRALQLAPTGELAEKIKSQQRRLADRVMRANAQGLPRMDAVMYLSSALEAYRSLDPEAQKQLLAEVAAVGQKGLAINNPNQKHQLRLHQGGATVSALQVTCILYVGVQLLLEADAQHEVALSSALEASGDDWSLLRDTKAIAEAARYRPDSRVHRLEAFIRAHLCPRLGQEGAEWNGERLLIFTEYADTKDWLERRVRELIAGSDQAESRIATFHGGIGDEKREAIKRSFNSPPDTDPLRILIATDAAREGVNLQNHCKRLVHFDVPWNPGRMEQRNGRIDRTLQRSPQVYCHYFVLPQRP